MAGKVSSLEPRLLADSLPRILSLCSKPMYDSGILTNDHRLNLYGIKYHNFGMNQLRDAEWVHVHRQASIMSEN